MKGDSGNTAGPGLNTGGPGPKPSRDWKKSGGNVDGGRTGDIRQESTPAPDCRSVGRDADERRGYSVLGKSPTQSDPQDWGKFQGAQHPKGIKADLDRDGSYVGGRGAGAGGEGEGQ